MVFANGARSYMGESLQALSPAFEADVKTVWDFRAAVDRRSAEGGTAPASVVAQIAAAKARTAGG